jgi:signal peptidase I
LSPSGSTDGTPRHRVPSLLVALTSVPRALAALAGREAVAREGASGGPSGAPAPAPAPAPTTPARASSARDDAHRHRGRNGLLIAALLVVLLGWLVVRPLVAEPFRIPSASMAPTIQAGDHVLVDKLAHRDALPARGDLVAFRAPGSSEVMIKRVIGVPGDRVGIEDGVLVVNGSTPRESFADPEALDAVYFGPVAVRPGTVFVLGDNRADSVDSREFGAVPADRLIGDVAARIWPPSRWGTP